MGWDLLLFLLRGCGAMPMVSSLFVLFLPMSHPPQWEALPLLPADMFPQSSLVGSGKGETSWQPSLVQPKAKKKRIG